MCNALMQFNVLLEFNVFCVLSFCIFLVLK